MAQVRSQEWLAVCPGLANFSTILSEALLPAVHWSKDIRMTTGPALTLHSKHANHNQKGASEPKGGKKPLLHFINWATALRVFSICNPLCTSFHDSAVGCRGRDCGESLVLVHVTRLAHSPMLDHPPTALALGISPEERQVIFDL